MIKSIYEEDTENTVKGTTNLVDPSDKENDEESLLETANKLDEVLGTDGSNNDVLYGENAAFPESPLVPVEYSNSSAKCIVKEQGLEEGELDPTTATALKLRYRIFNDTSIRMSIDTEKNVWFVADDIVKVLGYKKDTATVIKQHCHKVYDSKDLDGTNELAKKLVIDTKGGKQAMIAISEPDVYRLIMRSNMPEARNFERWVVEDVLPSIRKTGKYAVKRKIEFSNPEDQAKFEAAKTEASGQCELFPRMVPSVSLPADITDRLNSVKKRLFEQGHTFPNNKEFVKFLVNKALEDLEG